MGLNKITKNHTLITMLFLVSISTSFCQVQDGIDNDSVPVFFDASSYRVNTVSTTKLLESIKFRKSEKILLKGYTDTIGSTYYNQRLANLRIKAVSKILKVKNPSITIETYNYNEKHHIKSLDDKYYRRVDIIRTISDEKLEVVYDTPIILKINFVIGSAILTKNSYKSLKELLEIMMNDSKLRIELRGHVCCSSDYNLSLQRAQKVENYLIKNGVKHYRISTDGLSNSNPLVKEVVGANIEKNMRVEVVFKR